MLLLSMLKILHCCSEKKGKKEISENEKGVPHGEEVQVTGRDGMSNHRGQAEGQTRKTFKLDFKKA